LNKLGHEIVEEYTAFNADRGILTFVRSIVLNAHSTLTEIDILVDSAAALLEGFKIGYDMDLTDKEVAECGICMTEIPKGQFTPRCNAKEEEAHHYCM